jgi:hypothetical protein
MPTPHENREKGTPHERAEHGAKRERTRHAGTGETEELIFTISVATGAVVKVEKVDSAGKRHDIPKDETVALAGKDNLHEIEAALDEAFEAGISSVLGGASDDEGIGESAEEVRLRRILIAGIISRDVRRRLQRRLVQRLILSRTLRH